MSKALARAELVATLAPRMAARGFPLVKSLHAFKLKQPGLKQAYYLEFIDYGDHFSVRPAVDIRIDEVARVFHRTSGFEKQYQSSTPTLSVSLWRLSEDLEQFQYDLGDVDQVPRIAALIESVFDTVVAPYFDKYSTVAAVDSLLNKELYSVHYIMPWVKCSHGLIAARLNQRHDYDDLAAVYSKHMKWISSGFYSDRFEALVRDLEDDELIERSRRKLQAQGLLTA